MTETRRQDSSPVAEASETPQTSAAAQRSSGTTQHWRVLPVSSRRAKRAIRYDVRTALAVDAGRAVAGVCVR